MQDKLVGALGQIVSNVDELDEVHGAPTSPSAMHAFAGLDRVCG